MKKAIMIHKYYKALLTDCLWRDFTRQNLVKKKNKHPQNSNCRISTIKKVWDTSPKESRWRQVSESKNYPVLSKQCEHMKVFLNTMPLGNLGEIVGLYFIACPVLMQSKHTRKEWRFILELWSMTGGAVHNFHLATQRCCTGHHQCS